MKRVVLALLVAIPADADVAAPPSGIQRVAWLSGCWAMDSAGRTVEESWMPPRGDSMVGVSRTVKGDRLTEYELMVIREQGARLAYEAHPSGQATATFLSTDVGRASIVFENANHDFPQRIGYERKQGDALAAWIEGTQNGQARRVDFPYRRAACPAK